MPAGGASGGHQEVKRADASPSWLRSGRVSQANEVTLLTHPFTGPAFLHPVDFEILVQV